jgi:hypothetical protein
MESHFGEMESLFGVIESRFGEENGEVNRVLAKKMAKSIALWRKYGEEMAKNMANSIALYWGFKGDIPYDIVGSSLRFFIRIYIKF